MVKAESDAKMNNYPFFKILDTTSNMGDDLTHTRTRVQFSLSTNALLMDILLHARSHYWERSAVRFQVRNLHRMQNIRDSEWIDSLGVKNLLFAY